MKIPTALCASLLLLASCDAAWSQTRPKVAVASSPADVLLPTSELHTWVPSASPPSLTCPAGATQERQTTATGWETWCARGGVKHGPLRSFDRAGRRETRSTYEDGKLHGPASAIQLRPRIALAQAHRDGAGTLELGGADELIRAAADAATWLPSASPPRLACPEGTSQHDETRADGWTAECRRADGSAHGPRRVQWQRGEERRTTMENGRESGATIVLHDGRTVTETVYDRGTQLRQITWTSGALATLEASRGQRRALLRFHPNGAPAQLSWFKGDLRDGEWQLWHENGQRAELIEYERGEERSGARRWDDQGHLVEIRKLQGGNGTIETINPGRGDEKTVCELKGGKRHGTCRTTTKSGQLTAEIHYVDGENRSSKIWRESGELWTEWSTDPQTGRSGQTNYGMNGRIEQVSECAQSSCRTVQYDDKGNPKPASPPTAQGQPATTADDVLRSIADLL